MTDNLTNSDNEQQTEGEKSAPSKSEKKNQIAEAITRFLHRARDIKWSARVFVPTAYEMMEDRYNKALKQIENGELLLVSTQAVERVHGMKEIQEAVRKLERLGYSQIPKIVENSLFLSLFSAFDEYTGELLTAIYERKPQLFDKLNRKVDLVDVLTASSIEDLKRTVLSDVIESFRRKSYIEQFSELEATFGLTLREFERWPDFVECTQRRNLLTHCGGIVSEQYRNICKEENYPERDIPQLGSALKLGAEYFLPTCELMIEVGLKLGQTLWRKILPEELNEADKHLNHTQYDALNSQNWERAKVFGEFAVGQKKYSDEVHKRIGIVNYCIALKFSGDTEGCLKQLKKIDWSASVNDFRLAEAVLNDRFKDAASIMVRIGKSGEMVNEGFYHTWPLFNEFRESAEFMNAYEEIYGYPFIAQLKRHADAALTDASTREMMDEAKLAKGNSSQENPQ